MNFLYNIGRTGLLSDLFDWNTSTFRLMLLRTVAGPGAGGSIVYSSPLVTDFDLTAIPTNAYCRAAISAVISGKTTDNTADPGGAMITAPVTFAVVPTGDACQAAVLYHDNGGVDLNSHLVAYIDTATGLPVRPSGADIEFSWANVLDIFNI